MTGCTYSHHAVARMMTRMRNLDDVTEVNLSRSERKEDTTAAGTGAATTDAQTSEDVSDCVGSSRVTKFDLLVQFGGATGVAPASADGAAAAATAAGATGAAAPVPAGGAAE